MAAGLAEGLAAEVPIRSGRTTEASPRTDCPRAWSMEGAAAGQAEGRRASAGDISALCLLRS